jgi:hypothetical protein
MTSGVRLRRRLCITALVVAALAAPALAQAPVIDNDRVTVWEVAAGQAPRVEGDYVWVSLSHPGEAAFRPEVAAMSGRGVLIKLTDRRVAPAANGSGYPLAFPREGVRKVFENDRVILWDYSWKLGRPTPMHFHDKEVVVVYLTESVVRSVTPDGQQTTTDTPAGTVRFNLRNRVHSEEMVRGEARALITELK